MAMPSLRDWTQMNMDYSKIPQIVLLELQILPLCKSPSGTTIWAGPTKRLFHTWAVTLCTINKCWQHTIRCPCTQHRSFKTQLIMLGSVMTS